MAEHTKLPWRNDQKPDALIVCDAEGGSIADCAPPGPWMSHTVALANAAFIVKAVNAHAALVKALEKIAAAKMPGEARRLAVEALRASGCDHGMWVEAKSR